MSKHVLKPGSMLPSVFDDFFRPWNEWYENKEMWPKVWNVPAVNITEEKEEFKVALAVPGMKKDDFNIDMEGNMLTISCEKEENKEEKDKKFTRKEYSFSSFCRSFTLPEDVNREKIDARYENGVLMISLPKKEEAKKLMANKHIAVR